MQSAPTAVGARLSVMMFLQFFIWGSWYVTAPSFLGKIGFGEPDLGWTYSVGPIAAMISPLFVGMVADRFFAAQRVLGVLHLGAAAIMYLATTLMRADHPSPAAVNWAFLGYMLCYFPTLALTNALAMRNITSTEKQFPLIRVFGTLGWIGAGVALWLLGAGSSIEMFHLTIGGSVALGLYSFTLPHTPPAAEGPTSISKLLGLDALVLLKERRYAVFMVCSFLICIPLAFYYQYAERTVQTAGFADNAPFIMTFGQMSEVLFMAVMPFFFVRLGVKWMLALGMAAWVLRYALFAFGVPIDAAWAVLLGVALHGICYDFFFVTGQIYTDNAAPRAIRAQAQGLLLLFTLGLGMLIGAKVAGFAGAAATPPPAEELRQQSEIPQGEALQLEIRLESAAAGERAALEARAAELKEQADELKLGYYELMDWQAIWMWPAVGSAGVLVLFLLLFHGGRKEAAS